MLVQRCSNLQQRVSMHVWTRSTGQLTSLLLNWDSIRPMMQYSMLLMMMAQVAGLEAGELVHVIADCHIYDLHIPAVKAMLENEGYDAPTFKIDESITDFYAFTKNSFSMENYKFHEFKFDIPMAI